MAANLNLEDHTLPDIFIEPETLLTKLIRYGLYIGAVFQLACIFAVIFIKDDKKRNSCIDSDTESSEISPQLTPRKSHHRSRKMEKKKKR